MQFFFLVGVVRRRGSESGSDKNLITVQRLGFLVGSRSSMSMEADDVTSELRKVVVKERTRSSQTFWSIHAKVEGFKNRVLEPLSWSGQQAPWKVQ